jgi:hypothetical protein
MGEKTGQHSNRARELIVGRSEGARIEVSADRNLWLCNLCHPEALDGTRLKVFTLAHVLLPIDELDSPPNSVPYPEIDTSQKRKVRKRMIQIICNTFSRVTLTSRSAARLDEIAEIVSRYYERLADDIQHKRRSTSDFEDELLRDLQSICGSIHLWNS